MYIHPRANRYEGKTHANHLTAYGRYSGNYFAKLDCGYGPETDRQDLSAEVISRIHVLLTRLEDAFRDVRGRLMQRRIRGYRLRCAL